MDTGVSKACQTVVRSHDPPRVRSGRSILASARVRARGSGGRSRGGLRRAADAADVAEALRSDDEVAASWIGQPDVLNAPIRLVEYDPGWPARFEREAARIRIALGCKALLVEHVGSTAVPRLVAKPRIDIVLAVADSNDEAQYVPALEAVGYVLRIREPDWYEHRAFKGPDTDINLHVFRQAVQRSSACCASAITCANSDQDRLVYEQKKLALARRTWKYRQHYADAKTQVVEEILARAGTGSMTPRRYRTLAQPRLTSARRSDWARRRARPRCRSPHR